jgi:hypothetical protein
MIFDIRAYDGYMSKWEGYDTSGPAFFAMKPQEVRRYA